MVAPMPSRKPLHLTDLDPARTAEALTWDIHARAQRYARRLGMILALPKAADPTKGVGPVIGASRVYKAARTCAEWAVAGKGNAEEVAAALRELRADLQGVAPGDAADTPPDLATPAGVVVVAAAARLAMAEGRAVDADDIATLASVDARTIRNAVAAGTLQPVARGRPMRFAADVVRAYLYTRGAQGFAAAPPVRGP
jgi:hypothetical protein